MAQLRVRTSSSALVKSLPPTQANFNMASIYMARSTNDSSRSSWLYETQRNMVLRQVLLLPTILSTAVAFSVAPPRPASLSLKLKHLQAHTFAGRSRRISDFWLVGVLWRQKIER
jgi:hypothetical protein